MIQAVLQTSEYEGVEALQRRGGDGGEPVFFEADKTGSPDNKELPVQ